MTKNNKGLGKGLSALIMENKNITINNKASKIENKIDNKNEKNNNHLLVEAHQLKSGRFQPRKIFNEYDLKELSESIKENGIIQPIVVMPIGNDKKYEIIAGERRWRASQSAGLNKVPVIISNVSDKKALEIALIENIQRKDLNIIEEAEAYKKMLHECDYTQEDLSKSIGKSRSHITNLLRLLNLPKTVQQYLIEEKISMGHARAIIKSPNAEEIAKQIIENSLNVRQVEELIKKINVNSSEIKSKKSTKIKSKPSTTSTNNNLDADLVQIRDMIAQELGLGVEITQNENSGYINIKYENINDIDLILRKLNIY